MNTLVLRAFAMLLTFQFYLWRGNFAALHDKVRSFPVYRPRRNQNSVAAICEAVDLAAIWYPKEVLCLQRSAAAACLLKRYGHSAQLVIGARRSPFKAHAWVELGGQVVNDKPYVPEIYAVLDRC
jgi:transglutaminase superfamily protein